MVKFRPHTLKFTKTTLASDVVQDADGFFVPNDATTAFLEYRCRAESNSSGVFIASNDGGSVLYSWLIYLDKNVEQIEYGQPIEVYDETNTLIAKGNCKKFLRSQINSKLWV